MLIFLNDKQLKKTGIDEKLGECKRNFNKERVVLLLVGIEYFCSMNRWIIINF